MTRIHLTGATVCDGIVLHEDAAVAVEDGRVAGIVPARKLPRAGQVRLDGGFLAPGFIDLQVNGGGGVMLGDAADLGGIRRICAAHAGQGTTGLLPTLITDTPQVTRAVIAAGIAAAEAGVPGFLGLHLEGPHLDPRRKGAHDPARIRPMEAEDLDLLCASAARLPKLMVTLAPEAVTTEQITALARAGVLVSLGHSDTDHATAMAAFAAGASCVTHLFNAMSPFSHRAPGLVGAALDAGVHVSLIGDCVHVAPEAIAIALRAKRGPGRVFLVSDTMAVAGTDLDAFTHQGRRIIRREGRLTLHDGTLAGADCDLATAAGRLVSHVGVACDEALRMVTSYPATCIGARAGRLQPGAAADLVHLDADLRVQRVWLKGIAHET